MDHIRITPDLLGRLAAAVTPEMRHTQKLDAFAAVLGFPHQTALMRSLASQPAYEPTLEEMIDDLITDTFRTSLETDTGRLSRKAHAQGNPFQSLEAERASTMAYTREQFVGFAAMCDAYRTGPETPEEKGVMGNFFVSASYGWLDVKRPTGLTENSGSKLLHKMGMTLSAGGCPPPEVREAEVRQIVEDARSSWGLLPPSRRQVRVLTKLVLTKMAKTLKAGLDPKDAPEALAAVARQGGDPALWAPDACPTVLENADADPVAAEAKSNLLRISTVLSEAKPVLHAHKDVHPLVPSVAYLVEHAHRSVFIYLEWFRPGNLLVKPATHISLPKDEIKQIRVLLGAVDTPWARQISDSLDGYATPYTGYGMEFSVVDGLLRRTESFIDGVKPDANLFTQQEFVDLFKVPATAGVNGGYSVWFPFEPEGVHHFITYLSVAYPDLVRAAKKNGKPAWEVRLDAFTTRWSRASQRLGFAKDHIEKARQGRDSGWVSEAANLVEGIQDILNLTPADAVEFNNAAIGTRTVRDDLQTLKVRHDEEMTGAAMRELNHAEKSLDTAMRVLHPRWGNLL